MNYPQDSDWWKCEHKISIPDEKDSSLYNNRIVRRISVPSVVTYEVVRV